MVAWYITVLVAICITVREVHGSSPTIGPAYNHKISDKSSTPLPDSESVRVQSASTATQTLPCDSDTSCQALCPTRDITSQQPALSTAAVQQQLAQCANAMRISPNSFAADYNAVCNYADFQSDVINPQRPAFVINDQLGRDGSQSLDKLIAERLVAEAHAVDMATTNFFNHYSQNGSSPFNRINAVFPSVSTAGELIAAGWTNIKGLMAQFMCSAKHRDILMSCSYDTIGWGAIFKGSDSGLPAAAQWPAYFTGDLACSNGASCTCTSSPQDLQAVSQSSLSQVYSSLIPQVAFQISFDSIAASTAQVSQVTELTSALTTAVQAATAPVQLNVTVTQAGTGGSSNRRRLLQSASPTEQSTVTFMATFTAATASSSSSALQSDLSAALTAYIGSRMPVSITYLPANATAGVAFNVSVQFPPKNQLSAQESYSTQQATAMANDLEQNSDAVLSTAIAKDGPVTVSSTQIHDVVVQAVAASSYPPVSPVPVVSGASPGGSPAQGISPSSGTSAAAAASSQASPTPTPTPAATPQAMPAPTLQPSSTSSGVAVAPPYASGGGGQPTIQATVNATLTFTSLPSSTAPDPNLAAMVASDISAYVGGIQPLVGIIVDTSGPDMAVNISAVYPTNSQITGADTVVPASIEASKLADGLRTEPSAVFTGLIAKAGALTVTNLLDYEKVVQAGGPPVPSAPLTPESTPASTPASGTVPSPTATPSSPSTTPSSTPASSSSSTPIGGQSPEDPGTSAVSPSQSSPSPTSQSSGSGNPVLQPSVQFILTFSNMQASAVTDPKGLETLVAMDLQTYMGSNALAKLTEQPMTNGQNWALNITVFLEPDTMSQVSQGTAQAQTLAGALQNSDTVFPSAVAKAGSVAASGIQTFVKVITAPSAVSSTARTPPPSPSGLPASPIPQQTPAATPVPGLTPVPVAPPSGPAQPTSSPTPGTSPSQASSQGTLQTVAFSLALTDVKSADSSGAQEVEGFMTSDIQSFSANGPANTVSYVEDNSGPTLLLNVSIAYPGSADQASQTFQNAQTAAQNLATTINTSPGMVFKTLVSQKIHGRVEGVMIWGPTAAPPSGGPSRNPAAQAPSPPSSNLVLNVLAVFPLGTQAVAQNFSSLLQSSANTLLQPVSNIGGTISVSGVTLTQAAQNANGAIESYSGPPASFMPLAPSAMYPYPAGIAATQATFASYRQLQNVTQLYAINMQFSSGQAWSDKINNLFLLTVGSLDTTVPSVDSFTTALSGGQDAAITAFVPYPSAPQFYFVQVSSSPLYTGPVILSYAGATKASLAFTIVPQLVVKITACSFPGLQ